MGEQVFMEEKEAHANSIEEAMHQTETEFSVKKETLALIDHGSDNAEKINLELKEHQENVADWDFGLLMKEIHRWVEIFQFEFKLKLPQPAIGIGKLERRIGGNFKEGRATFGTKDTIVINELHIDVQFSIFLGKLHS